MSGSTRRPGTDRRGRGTLGWILGGILLLAVGAVLVTGFTAGDTVPSTHAGVSSQPLQPGEFPPSSTMAFPATGAVYGNTTWNGGCSSAICGSAHDSAGGSNVAIVAVSILGPTGHYWNGTDFNTATSAQTLSASGTTSWSLAFPASNFATAGGGQGSYTVKSYATDNAGNTQAPAASVTFTLSTSPPTNSFSLTTQSPAASALLSGNTVFYRGSGGGSGGSFNISNALQDSGSGPASSTTASLGGTSTGWSHTASSVSSPSGGPYVSNTFAWVEGTSAMPSETLTGADVAGNTATTTLSFRNDSTPPTGTVTYLNGYTNAGTVSVAFSATDNGLSGVNANSAQLERAQAPLRNGTCGVFGGFSNIGPAGVSSPYSDSAVSTNTCYAYEYVVSDNVGNQAAITSTSVVMEDTSPPANALALMAQSGGGSFLIGNTVYYQGSTSGSLELANTVSDTGSGPASSQFAALASTPGPAWSFTGSTVSTPSGGPYVSGSLSWTAGATSSPTETVTSADAAGNVGPTTTLTFVNDSTPASGGALTVNGTAATVAGSSTMSTTGGYGIAAITDYADAGSGLASSTLVRDRSPLTSADGVAAGTCGSTWTNATPLTSRATPISQSLPGPFCYLYTLTGTDNVGNSAAVSTIVMVDTTAPSVPLLTVGVATGSTFVSGSTVYVDAQVGKSGSFSVAATAIDNDSGILKLNFPALTGFSGGGGDDASSPYSSGTYSWSGAVGAAGAQTVTATNTGGLTSSASFTVTSDSTPPAGGALSVNGVAASGAGTASSSSSATFAIGTRTDYSDNGSGLATSTLTRQTSALASTNGIAAGSCGSFGAATVITGSPSQTVTAPACYLYTLTGTDNVGNSAAVSTIVMVDTTAPSVPLLTVGVATGSTFVSGSTVYVDAQVGKSGSFSVAATAIDNDSGILKLNFPALTGFSGGGGDDASSPYSSGTYSWSGAVGAAGAQTVTATNTGGLTSSASFTVTSDSTPPAGGALSVNGVAASGAGTASSSSSATFAIGTRTDYSDNGSGLATSTLTRQTSALASTNGIAAGSCGSFGAATVITGSPSQTVTAPACYLYTLTGTDNVGNSAAVSTIVMVDTTAPSVPLLTVGVATGSTFVSGSTVYVDAQVGKSGSFSVAATAIDNDSGILKLNFPALTGFSGGGGDDASSPYSSGTYSWSGAVGAAGAQTVTATNTGGLTSSASFTVTSDSTPPAGGALSVNGVAASGAGTASSSSSATFAIGTRTDYSDNGSGLATSTLQIQSETLAAGICGAAGSGGSYVSPQTISGTTNPAITSGFCYLYTLTGSDNVGNASTISTTVQVGASPDLTDVAPGHGCPSTGCAWATGALGTILYSATGPTFEAETSGVTATLNAVTSPADNAHVWVVGNAGTILECTTNCQTPASAIWNQQTSNTTANLYAVAASNNNNVWAVGAGGLIDYWNGTVWTVQQSGKSYDLLSIGGSATGTGWAVGTGGTILVTTNGTTWSTQAAPAILGSTTYTLEGLSSPSASRAWAVGAGGAIITTTNTGATWTQATSPTANTLYGVVATGATPAAATPVYAVGAGGVVVESTNGTTFAAQSTPTTNNLYGTASQSGSTLWAVGQAQTILYTTTTGATWTDATTPLIGLSPSAGVSGATVTVSGSNFAANSALSGKFNGSALTLGGTTITTSAGTISGTTFTVPGSLSAGSVYQVALTDAAGNRGVADFTVNAAPAITSASSATFALNSASSFTVTATGFPAPTLSESGTLPAGISFASATGLLSGTATGSLGSFPITFTAANGIGSAASQGFTLVVDQAPAITSASSTTFAVGAAGSFTATATGTPAPTFSETGSLPSGVTLNSAGLLAGTPATSTGGSYPVTITATSVAGSANQSFTLVVDQAPAITSASSTTFAVGAADSFTATATGTPAPTFSETGSLPSGVTLSPAGLLSGTPAGGTAGSYPLTITATSASGSANQSFTLTVSSFTIGGIQFVQVAPIQGTYTCTASVVTSVSCTAGGTAGTNLTGHIEFFTDSGAYTYPETPTANTSGSPITITSAAVTGGAGTPSPASATIPAASADSNNITLVHAGPANVWKFTYTLNSTTYTLTVTVS